MSDGQMKHLFWHLYWASKGFKYRGIHLHWGKLRFRVLPLNIVWVSKYLKRIEKASQIPAPNPNPSRWGIMKHLESGKNLLVKIKYPDCTNYEGVKILLYLNTTLNELTKQQLIDPHFSEDSGYKSPIARFEPTKNGWDMGLDCLFRL